MQYITATDLAERPGARELSQVATAAHLKPVAWELMAVSYTHLTLPTNREV